MTFNENYHEGLINQVQVQVGLLDELWKSFAEVQDEIEIYEDPSGA